MRLFKKNYEKHLMRNPMIHFRNILVFVLFLFVGAATVIPGESDEICLECHSDHSLTKEENGRKKSVYINGRAFAGSVHAEGGCISCHYDVDPDDLPHAENLEKVDCSTCHTDIVDQYNISLHGRAHKQGKYLAPTCITCHGKHNILSHKNTKAPTYVLNIPNLCGSCHKEGTPVSKIKSISEHKILQNYSQSIHGDGLFKRGLIVTAVCISCHNSHEILPHEDPRSSINRYNIPKTCMQCHANIEQVHVKVINGQLWEKKPHQIPVCVDCHRPHKTRRVIYTRSFPDEMCLNCHKDKNIYKMVDGKKKSLYVDSTQIPHSVHKGTPCIKCHTNVSEEKNPVCLNSGKVDCSMCHAEVVTTYDTGIHGKLHKQGEKEAPYCTDCHGIHNVMSHKNYKSPTFVKNIPDLCGNCHREGMPASRIYMGKDHEVVKKYSMSIHGKGLLESGLIVTATCIDCHTSHHELPAIDSTSTVNKKNISNTCSKCHLGIYEEFRKSIHSPEVTKTDKTLPVCNDCHFSHAINRVDDNNFRQEIISRCGKCHEKVAETYFDTFHGKVSKLGSAKTAKCYDCHGSHNILPVSNPKSTLSRENIVQTCKKCHSNSNRKFVGYLTHATHHNRDKYPYLYYTFWFMTILLVGTFTFFGLHTLLWLPRALVERAKSRKNRKKANKDKESGSNGTESDDIAEDDNESQKNDSNQGDENNE